MFRDADAHHIEAQHCKYCGTEQHGRIGCDLVEQGANGRAEYRTDGIRCGQNAGGCSLFVTIDTQTGAAIYAGRCEREREPNQRIAKDHRPDIRRERDDQ